MARSIDRRPGKGRQGLIKTRGDKRELVGRVTPGDHVEVSREIERIWAKLDNVKAIGGGSSVEGDNALIALWYKSSFPSVGPVSAIWRVPYLLGASVNYTVNRVYLRSETDPTAGTYTCRFEKSNGGSVFTPTTIEAVSITPGNQDAESTSIDSASLQSGQLLRIRFTQVGAGARIMTAQLEAGLD